MLPSNSVVNFHHGLISHDFFFFPFVWHKYISDLHTLPEKKEWSTRHLRNQNELWMSLRAYTDICDIYWYRFRNSVFHPKKVIPYWSLTISVISKHCQQRTTECPGPIVFPGWCDLRKGCQLLDCLFRTPTVIFCSDSVVSYEPFSMSRLRSVKLNT